jgi:cytochrome c oxidase subunit IV
MDVRFSPALSYEREVGGDRIQMTGGDMSTMQATRVPGMKSNAALCAVFMCIVGIEVFVTYRHLSSSLLLSFLLVSAFLESGIAVMYFMHLKYERPKLFWSLIPVLLFVLFMMGHMWPDAIRLENFRVVHW